MIPMLLWRCPLCAADDALVHTRRRFRADLVSCRVCQAGWRVRRVPGDNYYLKVLNAGHSDRPGVVGDERSITAWYDIMKTTLRLVPVVAQNTKRPELESGEELYLASGQAELYARKPSGLVSQLGHLFLTDRRLIWQAEGTVHSFSLNRLNSAQAVMDYGLALMVEMDLYTVHFWQESLLKWVTYLSLVAVQVEKRGGHCIVTSHF